MELAHRARVLLCWLSPGSSIAPGDASAGAAGRFHTSSRRPPHLHEYLQQLEEPEPAPSTPQLLSEVHGGDLMDLGAEAQAQGRTLALRAIMNRLAGVGGDLETLAMPDAAETAWQLRTELESEVVILTQALERRGMVRRGELDA